MRRRTRQNPLVGNALLFAGIAVVGYFAWKRWKENAAGASAVIRNPDGSIAAVLPPQSGPTARAQYPSPIGPTFDGGFLN